MKARIAKTSSIHIVVVSSVSIIYEGKKLLVNNRTAWGSGCRVNGVTPARIRGVRIGLPWTYGRQAITTEEFKAGPSFVGSTGGKAIVIGRPNADEYNDQDDKDGDDGISLFISCHI